MNAADRHAQLLLWAQQLLVKGLPLDALALAERAVEEAPEDVFARILLVRALLSSGKARRAETEATAALSTAQTDEERALALAVLAMSLAASGRASVGIGPAREAARLMEGDPRPMIALVLCLAEGGERAEARQLAEDLANLAPLAALPYLTLAMVDIAEKKTEEAELSLRRAVELDEDDEGLALELAAVLLAQKKQSQALESLIHAAERNPESEAVRTAAVQTALRAKGAHTAVFFLVWVAMIGPVILGVLFGDRAIVPIVVLLFVGVAGFALSLVRFSRASVPPGAQRLLDQQARMARGQARRSLANVLLGIGLVVTGIPREHVCHVPDGGPPISRRCRIHNASRRHGGRSLPLGTTTGSAGRLRMQVPRRSAAHGQGSP